MKHLPMEPGVRLTDCKSDEERRASLLVAHDALEGANAAGVRAAVEEIHREIRALEEELFHHVDKDRAGVDRAGLSGAGLVAAYEKSPKLDPGYARGARHGVAVLVDELTEYVRDGERDAGNLLNIAINAANAMADFRPKLGTGHHVIAAHIRYAGSESSPVA